MSRLFNYVLSAFYPRDAMLAQYFPSSCVRPSVCLSVFYKEG